MIKLNLFVIKQKLESEYRILTIQNKNDKSVKMNI